MSKTIEHVRGLQPCRHTGRHWDQALSLTFACLGVYGSESDENEIIKSLSAGQAVWHRGFLLTAYQR